MKRDDYITASEVAEFLYCQRAWWYSRKGAPSANRRLLDAGTKQHEILASEVHQVEQGRRIAWKLLLAGAGLLLLLIVLKLLTG